MAKRKKAAFSKTASRKPNPVLPLVDAPPDRNYCCTLQLDITFSPDFWNGVTITPFEDPAGTKGLRLTAKKESDRMCVKPPGISSYVLELYRGKDPASGPASTPAKED